MIARFARLALVAPLLSFAQQAARAQTAGGHTGMGGPGMQPPAVAATALDALIDSTRQGTARFADRRAAVAAGYHLVGMDFPSMGEHWVNTSRLMAGRFDPASPAILTYATVNGQPRLLGVVYAVVLGPGEKPPAMPGGAGHWHEHNGSIDEESLLAEHGGEQHTTDSSVTGTSTRLAILHAWTAVPNPAGTFVTENWALPFIRNGLSVPMQVDSDAARALALVSGGEEYFRRFFRIGTGSSDASSSDRASDHEAALGSAMRDARNIFDNRTSPTSLSSDELTALSDTWGRLIALLHLGSTSPAGRSLITRAP